ncbi:MAG: FKBP-type peptidyl-prolyl cis-trans isomerase [Muribaculaceae bacterium]|nr:FKBP-type peptidyl-prolyl cis-trans isomerase [Muribaculaceae bacterium]
MKKDFKILSLCAIVALSSCSLERDEPSDPNSEWRKLNDEWIEAKAQEKDAVGNDVYQKVTAPWDPNGYVLIQWHNDRAETASKLSPISTSTVDLRYEVTNIEGTLLDSSKKNVSPAPGVYRSVLNKNINGWILGISQMHIGDTCTILIPYNMGYGSVAYGGAKAYSNLVFNIRLVDIPGFEKP